MSGTFLTPRAFRFVGIATIAAVYFLILVGGIVRATGAGMGCPDWPKCFGRWVPPTHESQLPANYQEIYSHRGYADTTFNVVKTWTEYVNRLVGVFIGFLIFLTLIFSFAYVRRDPWVPLLSLASFVLVGFQGWLGAVVVASNLAPVKITLHMVVALVLVALLIYTVARSQRDRLAAIETKPHSAFPALLVAVLLLSLAQVILGTQVREHVDEIAVAAGESNRAAWMGSLGMSFYVHRSFSIVLLAANVAVAFTIWKKGGVSRIVSRCAAWLVGIVVIEIASGAAMYYFAIPPVLQPIHLLLASLMFGLQFFAIVAYRYGAQQDNASLAVS
jgi:cytochrome c oxidase assembly protein subunit 15